MSYCGPSWVSDYNYGKVLSALFNQQIRFKAGVPMWADETWQIEGALIHETLSLSRWQQHAGEVEPHAGGAYWVKLLSVAGDVLGQSSFGMTALDHVTDQHFYVSVNNDYAGEAVAAIVIGLGEHTLLRQIISGANSPTLAGQSSLLKPSPLKPLEQTVQAERLDDWRVSIRWPAKGEVLTVSNAQNEVLTRDKTGEVIVFTQDNSLQGELNNNGKVSRLLITVVGH